MYKKIRLARSEQFLANGRTSIQTDTTNVMVAFRSFTNAPTRPEKKLHILEDSFRTFYLLSSGTEVAPTSVVRTNDGN